MAISEKAGHMESILNTLADFTLGNRNRDKSLVSFLEPILLSYRAYHRHHCFGGYCADISAVGQF